MGSVQMHAEIRFPGPEATRRSFLEETMRGKKGFYPFLVRTSLLLPASLYCAVVRLRNASFSIGVLPSRRAGSLSTQPSSSLPTPIARLRQLRRY